MHHRLVATLLRISRQGDGIADAPCGEGVDEGPLFTRAGGGLGLAALIFAEDRRDDDEQQRRGDEAQDEEVDETGTLHASQFSQQHVASAFLHLGTVVIDEGIVAFIEVVGRVVEEDDGHVVIVAAALVVVAVVVERAWVLHQHHVGEGGWGSAVASGGLQVRAEHAVAVGPAKEAP